jgi:hypothetical protein
MTLLVFYYQHTDGKTKLVTVGGGYPVSKAPLWRNCNTSVLLCPGTDTEKDEKTADNG